MKEAKKKLKIDVTINTSTCNTNQIQHQQIKTSEFPIRIKSKQK